MPRVPLRAARAASCRASRFVVLVPGTQQIAIDMINGLRKEGRGGGSRVLACRSVRGRDHEVLLEVLGQDVFLFLLCQQRTTHDVNRIFRNANDVLQTIAREGRVDLKDLLQRAGVFFVVLEQDGVLVLRLDQLASLAQARIVVVEHDGLVLLQRNHRRVTHGRFVGRVLCELLLGGVRHIQSYERRIGYTDIYRCPRLTNQMIERTSLRRARIWTDMDSYNNNNITRVT